MTQTSITIRRPDDWHVHLRDGDLLAAVLPYTARQFARAIVMPNLTPPVTKPAAAELYRQQILQALPTGMTFQPLMTCYLTDDVSPADLRHGHERSSWVAAKLYPAHATTNSAHGVTDISFIRDALEEMERIGMPLLVHGEVTDPDVDVFDREAVFIDRILAPLVRDMPGLKIVLEHITTAEAASFVAESGPNVAATITPQHIILNRNALFAGGLRPHAYCLPVVKRERHRLAVRAAAVSGDPSFFLGTDSAPHLKSRKEMDCGCAGIFNAPYALESYLSVFEEDGALDRFEAFASLNGPAFYGLPVNEAEITLVREAIDVPAAIEVGTEALVPFHAGQTLRWRMQEPVSA